MRSSHRLAPQRAAFLTGIIYLSACGTRGQPSNGGSGGGPGSSASGGVSGGPGSGGAGKASGGSSGGAITTGTP